MTHHARQTTHLFVGASSEHQAFYWPKRTRVNPVSIEPSVSEHAWHIFTQGTTIINEPARWYHKYQYSNDPASR